MSGLFAIRREVSRQTQILLAVASWALVILAWFGLTHWGKLPPFALPRPEKVVVALAGLWTQYDLMGNVFQSWWRIAQAFFWCVVIAIPLGLFMGSFRWLHHFINPLAAPIIARASSGPSRSAIAAARRSLPPSSSAALSPSRPIAAS